MLKSSEKIKHKLILLVLTISFISVFGALLHSPPSVLDAITGATPKAKKAARASAKLEGNYIFCMNPSAKELSDEKIREYLKTSVSSQKTDIYTGTEFSFKIFVPETDYALIKYSNSLCKRLKATGFNAKIKKYSGTMLRSRILSGKYEVFLSESDLIDINSLENSDYIILDSTKMR